MAVSPLLRLASQRPLAMRFSPDWTGWALIAGPLLAGLVIVLALRVARQARALKHVEAEATRLGVITDQLPSLVAYLDTSARYRFVNPHFEQLLGVAREDALGRSVEEALGPEAWQRIQPHLLAAIAGEHRHFERWLPFEGRQRCLLTDYIPDRAPDGSVRGVVALAFDVTALKQAEAAAQEQRERLQRVADNLPALVAHLDTEQRYTFVNAQFRRVGMEPAQMLGRTVREMRPAFYDGVLRPHIEAALAGQPSAVEGSVERDGRPWHYRTDYVPDRNDSGQVRGCFSLTVDLTAIREAEIARAQAEERMRRVTDNLPALVSYIDTDERLRFGNATYREWLGKDPETLIGLQMREVLGPALYATREPYLRRALAGERVEFEAEDSAAGTTRVTHTTYIPDLDSQGKVRGLYAFNTDVTRLKRAESRLQALAHSDPLTGLPNRLHFDERIAEALARAARNGGSLALMFLDIDRFKLINDQFGHAAGDAVLVAFAQRLRESVRQTDLVARLAGDEFVVLLENQHSDAEPQFVARKLLAQFQRPVEFDGHALEITTSVGIAFHAGTQGPVTAAELLARADAALYEAKHAGRNTFRVA